MPPHAVDLLTPRILVVDDERKIHASLRVRLHQQYELVFCFHAREALEKLEKERFDLCFADIHMPDMDGFAFIDAARKRDPGLGYVVLSAFDSDRNLRRTIPLQVYDFVSKPLPERHEFEARIPEWISQTRQRRRDQELAQKADEIACERDSARLEREVELVASETARDALLQTASLLTTIHAHLVSAASIVAARARNDPSAMHLLRNLQEARKTADAVMSVADSFFGSAYGSRDSSPALINDGIRHAIGIAARMTLAQETNKAVDFQGVEDQVPIRGLTGIDFLLMVVPALCVALARTRCKTTVAIRVEHAARLDGVLRDPRWRNFIWLNRKHALISRAGIVIIITSAGSPLRRADFEEWLKGEYMPLARVTPRGLIAGIQKSHGLLGLSAAEENGHSHWVLALAT
jgi:CheY-like chemotaxis protein